MQIRIAEIGESGLRRAWKSGKIRKMGIWTPKRAQNSVKVTLDDFSALFGKTIFFLDFFQNLVGNP